MKGDKDVWVLMKFSSACTHTGPSGTPQDLSISVLSPSSVKLSWLPPTRDFWNGILTSYTVISHSLGPNNMSAMDDVELHLANSTFPDTYSTAFSFEDNKWSNNPDPRFYYSEVAEEDVTIDGLHEYFTYHFSVYISNSAGDSDPAESPLIQLPGTGTVLHVLMIMHIIRPFS